MTRDLFTPATRRTDPDTSHKAAQAQAASVPTIRARVLAHALEAGPAGFIDDDLVLKWTDHPESSFRKRRTELHQEGLLVDSGRRRTNRWGNEEIVWLHISFAPSDAPKVVAPPVSKKPRDDAALKTRGDGWARRLDEFARQMRSEGRGLFAGDLQECAKVMRELTRSVR